MSASTPGSKTTRVQVEFPKRSFQRLIALKEKTEAASYAEVMKNALRLYEEIILEYEKGNTLMIRTQHGETKEYKIFL